MPLYDFKCRECDHAFEQRVPVSVRVVNCPACLFKDGLRQFSVTRNISIPSAFGVNQRDYAPPREAREYLGNDSQSHAPAAESLEQFLERDLRA